MEYRSLTKAQRRAYHDAVASSHNRRIEVHLLDLNSKIRRDLTEDFRGGSVQGDVDNEDSAVTGSELQVLDLDGRLDWRHGEHMNYQVRVIDSRYVAELEDWVEETVFTGPIWDYDRQGQAVTIIAEGAEQNAMGSFRSGKTWKKKTKAHKVVRQALRLAGAKPRQILVPATRHRLPDDITKGVRKGRKDNRPDRKIRKRRLRARTWRDTYWGVAYEVAEALDRDLYADGRGRFLMRAPQRRPAYALRDRELLQPVTERRDTDGEQYNEWLVLGANPKGKKKRRRAVVRLPKKHPLSREERAYNNTPRDVTRRITNKHARTNRQCRVIGRRHRDRAVREHNDYYVEALPVIPWLRPNSLVSVPVEGGRRSVRVKQWTLPLGPGADPMVFGGNRRRRWRR